MRDDLKLKIPQESSGYAEASAYVIKQITAVIQNAIAAGNNRIFIHTNLKRGLPLENINKVAGPYIELEPRTVWEFLQLLDAKFIKSKGEDAWLALARKYGWIKEDIT